MLRFCPYSTILLLLRGLNSQRLQLAGAVPMQHNRRNWLHAWGLAWALCWALSGFSNAQANSDKEQALIDWMIPRGGQVGFRIGRECPTCLRGTIAARDFQPGDVITQVPINSTVRLTSGHGPEQANELLQRKKEDPEFDQLFALYWATLPQPGELLMPEQYTEEQLEMLQAPVLVALARQWGEAAEANYNLNKVGEELGVSMEEYLHTLSCITTRTFSIPSGTMMVPVIDMVNHSDNDHNAKVVLPVEGDEFVKLVATKPIKEGQTITFRYRKGIQRCDGSLFQYGFVERQDTPLLAGIDLPTFDANNPWAETEDNDDDHDPAKGGQFATAEEFERLQEVYRSMPTSELQDEMLLGSGQLAGDEWMIVEFRAQRKRALRQVLDRLKTGLESAAEL